MLVSSNSRWADWDIGSIRVEQVPQWYLLKGTYIGLKKMGAGTCLKGIFVVEIFTLITLFQEIKKMK